jgi:hypothetical protein
MDFHVRMKRLLDQDQASVSKPSYQKPFTSRKEAIERLLPYHLYHYSNQSLTTELEGESSHEKSLELLRDRSMELYRRYESMLKEETLRAIPTAMEVYLLRNLLLNELEEQDDLRKSLATTLPDNVVSSQEDDTTTTLPPPVHTNADHSPSK